MNVLLIGEQAAGARVLQSLAESGAKMVAVMSSSSWGARWAKSWDLASKLGYATWPAELVKESDFAAQVREAGVDLILNVHSLHLIRKEILGGARLGGFRSSSGPATSLCRVNSVCRALYRGETRHGVTLHKMVADIDAGPICYQEAVDVESERHGIIADRQMRRR